MQEAIPHSSRIQTTLNHQMKVGTTRERGPTRFEKDELKKMVGENAVIVFAGRGCCMSHVVRRLLQGLGANPAVYEVEDGCEDDLAGELRAVDTSGGGTEQLPVVFIGGRWFGGLDRIMATHITGELTPLLKQGGALWL